MAGISAIGGSNSMSTVELAAAYDARVASMQKDALEQQGEEALKLIQAASASGANLDIRI